MKLINLMTISICTHMSDHGYDDGECDSRGVKKNIDWTVVNKQ